MKEVLINAYRFNLQFATALVKDVNSALMTTPGEDGLENHPAFTLGHLAVAAALTSKYLGGPYQVPDNWDDLFRRSGPGDPKKPDLENHLYPTKKELLDELSKQHELVTQLIVNFDENEFQKPTKWRFEKHMPTLGELIYFMCITHETMHLGQLSGWRRAMNLPSALATL